MPSRARESPLFARRLPTAFATNVLVQFNAPLRHLLQSNWHLFNSHLTSLAAASDSSSLDMYRRARPVHIDRCRKVHPAVNSAQKRCYFTRRDQPSYPQSHKKRIWLISAQGHPPFFGVALSSMSRPQDNRFRFTTKQLVETPARRRILPLPI